MKKAEKLRELWEEKGNKNIKYGDRPQSDIINVNLSIRKEKYSLNNLKPVEERYENVIERYRDFAHVLEIFWTIYNEKYDNYGDSILAFIGQNLTRGWPWTDIPFHSYKAWKLIKEKSPHCEPTGLYDSEIKDSEFEKLRKKGNRKKAPIIYEHWTPMSFFRDVFVIAKENKIEVEKKDFLNLLVKYYRVVRITDEEDNQIENSGFKTNRPIDTYERLGIKIKEKELWEKLNNYGC